MKNVFDRLEQMARERIATRLKHLRGQHDQRDHAWNRGMGGGGGAGVELGPNQMGPLPTMQMYREQRLALMDQHRQGEITREEMRRQIRDLRGMTIGEPLNNVVLANQNKRVLVLPASGVRNMDDRLLAQIAKREVSKINSNPELLTTYQWRQVLDAIKKYIPNGAREDFGKNTLEHYRKLALGIVGEETPSQVIPEKNNDNNVQVQLDSLYAKKRELDKELDELNTKENNLINQINDVARQMRYDLYDELQIKIAPIIIPMAMDMYLRGFYNTFNLIRRNSSMSEFNSDEEAQEYIKSKPDHFTVKSLMAEPGVMQFIELQKMIEEVQDSGDLTDENTFKEIRSKIQYMRVAQVGSMFKRLQPPETWKFTAVLSQIGHQYQDTGEIRDAIKLASEISADQNPGDTQIRDNLMRLEIKRQVGLGDVDTMIHDQKPKKAKLQDLIANVIKEKKKISDEIKDLKVKMIDSGDALITKLYSDDESKKYFDASLAPDDTKSFLDTHVEFGEVISQKQGFIDVMKLEFGLDADNPEHVQIIGDILGVFDDGSSNMTIYTFAKNWNNSLNADTEYDDNNGKTFTVNRIIRKYDDKIVVKNDLFKQTNMQGMGRAALIRQIPAAIKLSRITGLPITIEANAYSRGSAFIGYHVWPKMSFNFEMNNTVADILRELGFDDSDLVDTATFMQSSGKAQDPDPYGTYAGMHFDVMEKLVGKNARQIWADVVELAVQNDGTVEQDGTATIDASDPNGPVQVFDLLLEEYNKELRLRKNRSTKSVRDSVKYKKYLDLIGFSMEDMDAFDAAWETVSKKKK